jgi:hypothetical protein
VSINGTCGTTVYLDPAHSRGHYGHTVDVELRANATNFQSGQIKLTYDPNCVNITNWARNTATFPMGGWDSSTTGQEWITFTGTAPLSGDYEIGTLTLQCTCEDECTTPLEFITPSALFDPSGTELPAICTDGSFECIHGICGDVAPYPDGDENVNMGDVSYPGQYSVADWAGNVNCIGGINMGDVVLLLNNVSYPGQYSLSCCQ